MGSDPCTWARRATSNKDKERSKFELHRPWAVGLAPALTDRDTWPPGGADLSFFLRTVIVDSLDLGHASGENEKRDEETGIDNGRQGVMEEAEFRLGFAIRDLPVGPGRDRWLNPTCECCYCRSID